MGMVAGRASAAVKAWLGKPAAGERRLGRDGQCDQICQNFSPLAKF